MSALPTRAVLTIAAGRESYLAFAANLARSFRHWHADGRIAFQLVTDLDLPLDPDLDFVRVHRAPPGSLGVSFTTKLSMDRFLSCDETLFVDADCLCTGPLDGVFDRFSGRDFSVIGREEREGENFGDIAHRCRLLGLPATVRFCGSLYFLRRGPTCAAVLEYARGLVPRYAELGLVPLRGGVNEEPLLGLAMAKFGQAPVEDDGSVKADLMFFNADPEVDVLRGRARAYNFPGRPKTYPEWRIPDEARPRLVHFMGGLTAYPPYTSEALCLRLTQASGWPGWAARAWSGLSLVAAHRLRVLAKALGRPVYQKLFGARPVRTSDRE